MRCRWEKGMCYLHPHQYRWCYCKFIIMNMNSSVSPVKRHIKYFLKTCSECQICTVCFYSEDRLIRIINTVMLPELLQLSVEMNPILINHLQTSINSDHFQLKHIRSSVTITAVSRFTLTSPQNSMLITWDQNHIPSFQNNHHTIPKLSLQ